jgi:uncharacterized protein YcnI
MSIRTTTAVGIVCAALAAPALAHITLETGEAPAGSAYKAVLRVGHGCKGAATTAVRVQIPDGAIAVHPMPKPGWTLETKTGPYPTPIAYSDQTLTEGVREIIWSGAELPDGWYDEFVFRVQLPDGEPGQVIYFPMVQECGDMVSRWIEIPAEGQTGGDLEEPAPSVTLTEATSDHNH